MKIIKITAIILMSLLCRKSNAQSFENPKKSYPVIGERCPYFLLKNVNYYDGKHTLSLKDLEGKFVILDFWAKDCVGCINKFPELNQFQKDFNDKLQFVLIGLDDSKTDNLVRKVYKKYKQKFNLQLPVAYDTLLFSPPFKMSFGVPWYVWIDNQGIVQAVTTGGDITSSNISKFLKSQKFSFSDQSYDATLSTKGLYNVKKPIQVNGNGGIPDSNFIYRSLLSNWKPGLPSFIGTSIDGFYKYGSSKIPKYECLGCTLKDLYTVAYTGEYFMHDSIYYAPIIESKRFYQSKNDKYCYSLIVPMKKASKLEMMKIMKNELKNIFGYSVSIEEREMPCLILKATKKARSKIKSKGSPPYCTGSLLGLEFTNFSIKDIMVALYGDTKDGVLNMYDETNIKGNVDLKIEADMTDLNEVNNALKKQGLEIIKGMKLMKVLVIKDAEAGKY